MNCSVELFAFPQHPPINVVNFPCNAQTHVELGLILLQWVSWSTVMRHALQHSFHQCHSPLDSVTQCNSHLFVFVPANVLASYLGPNDKIEEWIRCVTCYDKQQTIQTNPFAKWVELKTNRWNKNQTNELNMKWDCTLCRLGVCSFICQVCTQIVDGLPRKIR